MIIKRFSKFLRSEYCKLAIVIIFIFSVAIITATIISDSQDKADAEHREFFGYRDEIVFDHTVQATVMHKARVGHNLYLGVMVEGTLYYDLVSPSRYEYYNVGDKYPVQGELLLRRHV